MVLASSSFLYLAEPVADGGRRALTDVELASRLSYFLWSGPPDDVMLAAAARGDLRSREGLARQVDGMLADERSRAFVEAFASQWLRMSRLDFFQFNAKLYPDFNGGVKEAARQEVFETVAHLVRHEGSLSQLLHSDTVVINGLLADYYGIDGVAGDEFRPVKVPLESPRGGLLGMAAILAMGSNGEQTSPVERGAWVLRKLLHDPPPPAPPNVPQLTRLEGELVTTRERLRMHQQEPQCGSCHRRIDPIGFALENFDAVGRWRTEDSYEKPGVGRKTWPIDPAGALYGGPPFTDFLGFARSWRHDRRTSRRGSPRDSSNTPWVAHADFLTTNSFRRSFDAPPQRTCRSGSSSMPLSRAMRFGQSDTIRRFPPWHRVAGF